MKLSQRQGEVNAAQNIPDYPEDCRIVLAQVLITGERLDIALLRTSGLLKAQNNRINRCADWYDILQRSGASK
jgi:hypothetical protein